MKAIRVLFIHHSTGGLLIRFGRIRELLAQKAPHIELWDHAYNLYPFKLLSTVIGQITFRTGLSDAKGKMVGRDFNIVTSNNSPKEYADIFSRDSSDPTLKQILEFDVVMFKNCFPTSKIETVEKLEQYKSYYTQILHDIQKYSNKFVIFTQPPLRREMTTVAEAANARKLATWLVVQGSGEKKNYRVFNFFDLLADPDGSNKDMLKRRYCTPIPVDSHPNIKANREVGIHFSTWLVEFVSDYSKGR